MLTAAIYTHLMRERFEEGREKLEENMARQRGAASPRRCRGQAV